MVWGMLYVFVKGKAMLARKVLKEDDAVDELTKLSKSS